MGIYEQYFRLYDEPFRLTPDPRYLFLSEKHREVLAHLRLGTSESGGFVCITGDVGTGKTTLIRSFLDQLDPETPYAYLFNPPQSSVELLQTINAELGLRSMQPSRKELMDTLNAFLLEQRHAGHRPLVVVDEAQALSPEVLEELRLLSNLETTTVKLVQIVLFGQPQLMDVLRSADLAQLNQRITLRWHLGPLNARETAQYVRHRIRVAAGGVERSIFTSRSLARIHEYSGGVPRLINIFCHRGLLAAYAAESPRVTRRVLGQIRRELQRTPLMGFRGTEERWRGLTWAGAGAVVTALIGWALIGTGTVPLDLGLTRRSPDTPQRDTAQDAVDPGKLVEQEGSPAAEPGRSRVGEGLAMQDATESEESSQPEAPEVVGQVAMMTTATPMVNTDSFGEDRLPSSSKANGPTERDAAPLGASKVARMLLADTEGASTIAAVEAILQRWYERPLAPDEMILPMDLDTIASRRDLQHLSISGSVSMLRVLNLPAILELVMPGEAASRYVMLAGADENTCFVVLDGSARTVERSFLDKYWLGQAHIVWRDFEGLAPTLSKGSTGPRVRRLQEMLAQLDFYTGPITGVFGDETEIAVIDFQRSRRLFADALVGRLTRIALYDALGEYEHPQFVARNLKESGADS